MPGALVSHAETAVTGHAISVALENIKDKLKRAGSVEATRVKVRRTQFQLGLEDSGLLREVWEKVVELAEIEPGFVTWHREYARDYHIYIGVQRWVPRGRHKDPSEISPGADFVALELLAEVTDSTPDRRPELLKRLHATADELARKIRRIKPKVRRLFRWEAVVRHVYDHPEPDGGLQR